MTTPEVISRAEAKARGLVFYFTGQPCVKGGIAPRITRTWNCTCEKCRKHKSATTVKNRDPARAAELARKYKAANPDRARDAVRRWRDSNRAKGAEYAKQYRAKNQEAVRSALAVWRHNNKGKVAEHFHKRRASKYQATPPWYGEFDQFVMREAADLCRLRFGATGSLWAIDHMIPLQAREACGLHVAANLQVIPATVNFSKKNKMQLTEPGQWLHLI